MNRKENKIIKLLEKIIEQNQQIIDNISYKGLGAPWYRPWHDWVDWDRNKNIPPYPNTIPCPYCDKDTGIAQNLCMVIPPEGLKCPHCNRVVINGSPTITCEQPYSTEAVPMTNMNISCGNPEYKVYNEITHHPEMLGSPFGVTKVVETSKIYDNIYGEKHL